MRRNREKGQALVMVALFLGVVLVGAVGMALDTAQLYTHRQMAQAAADAAAQAGILSMFNSTNVGGNTFATATDYTHTCSTTDAITPCTYARKNGFGGTDSDTVAIDIPTPDSIGLDANSLSDVTVDPVRLLRVTITRQVSTWFIRMLGAQSTANIRATATAAIVGKRAATPILVTHPTLSGALSTGGTGGTSIIICGGPSESVHVNSSSPTAVSISGAIDLSHAGTADTAGDCTTGTGADLGVFGGPTAKPSGVLLGTTGTYRSPESVFLDPMEKVMAPKATALKASPPSLAPAVTTVSSPTFGCASTCDVYSPGLYNSTNAININGGNPIIFKPGLYYVQGVGIKLKNVIGGGGAPDYNAMCVGCAADAETGTGMVIFDTTAVGGTTTGGFDMDSKNTAGITLKGSSLTTTVSGNTVPAAPYYGLLLWEDSVAGPHIGSGTTSSGRAHSLGQGGGCLTLVGTVYATNPRSSMDDTHYQEVDYNGNPCSTTINTGYIIVSKLQLVGSSQIKMKLLPYGFLTVRRVALVR